MRRSLSTLWLLGMVQMVASTSSVLASEPSPDKLWLFVGTYTEAGSQGIYRVEMDLATGKLSAPELAAKAANPSFLAIHPSRRFLYAVGEVGQFRGKKSGIVSSFALDPATGKLTAMNQASSGGGGPCHLVVDRQGKHVLVANYGAGTVAALPLTSDGKLEEPSCVVEHKGSSVNRQRQEGPHAHSINLDPANRFAFAADLGLDKILSYRLDATTGTLTPNDPPAADLKPGVGPRHFTFHPDGRHAYVVNELESSVVAFDYDAERGVLKPVQTISILPDGYQGKSYAAEVQAHPSGKFLYASNRGHDSIAILRVDPTSGQLTLVGHQADHIKTPRNFAIDPSGHFLIVANQDSNDLVVFRIQPDTGELKPTGYTAKVARPVCIKMLAPER